MRKGTIQELEYDLMWYKRSDYIDFPYGKKYQKKKTYPSVWKIFFFIFVFVLLWRLVYEWKIQLGYNNKDITTNDPKGVSVSTIGKSYTVGPNWKNDLIEVGGNLLYSPGHSRDGRQKRIGRSSDYLYIWMYNITHRDTLTLMKKLAQHNVQLRFILEDKKYIQDLNSKDIGALGWGIQVKNDSLLWTNYVHAKWFISSDYFIIQTANLTNGGFNSSREYYFISENKQILDSLKIIYDKDWIGQKISPSDIHPNLLICPIDCRVKIQDLLSNANHSVLLQNQYLQDKKITDILKNKIDNGLDVKITIPDNLDNRKNTIWYGSGIKFVWSPYIHAKMILIDDIYLILSSINISSNSMDNNRELGIIIMDREIIEQFKKVFYIDRNKGK